MNPTEPQPLATSKNLQYLAAAGFGIAAFGRSVVALADGSDKVTAPMIEQASSISGINFTQEQREIMANGFNDLIGHYRALRRKIDRFFRGAARKPVCDALLQRGELEKE